MLLAMRRYALWLALAASLIAPSAAYAQVCPAVAALPDTERRVSYVLTSSVGPMAVTFAILGDGTDYSNWIEVWLNGVKKTGVTDWTLSIPSGSLATACRPITNASVSFTVSQTGTVEIVGARRPRRTSQFPENAGVSARNLNQVITDLTAEERERWDRDLRTMMTLPGETIGPLPSLSSRAGNFLIFDGSGNPSAASPTLGLGNVVGPSSATNNNLAVFDGTTGKLIKDGGPINLLTQVPTAPQGRLTLTSATPVTTADVAGATTLYYTPSAAGSYIPLTTDGIVFTMTLFAEVSQATTDATKSPAAVANNSCYDIFGWSDAGTFRSTRGPAWPTCDGASASRGTGAGTSEIDFTTKFPTNRVAITNGPAANRGVLLGTVRSNGTAQLTDSYAFRYVSNVYNAIRRDMRVFEAASTWTYTTSTFRQANANTANQLAFVQSLPGYKLSAYVSSNYLNTTTTNFGVVAIDLDTLNTTTVSNCVTSTPTIAMASAVAGPSATCGMYPGIGGHIAIWKEYSSSGGAGTFFGTGGGTVIQGGITGDIAN